MSRVRTFRDLIAWQKGMQLAERVYHATDRLPETEKFGLVAQMRRAAVSIVSNIAEGHGRQSRSDYLRFLRLARGSLGELSTQFELAVRLGFVELPKDVSDLLAEQDRILQGLIRSLERKKSCDGG